MARRWRWITADIGIAADLPALDLGLDGSVGNGFSKHDLTARSGLLGGGGRSPANDVADGRHGHQRTDLMAAKPRRLLFCEWIRQRAKPTA